MTTQLVLNKYNTNYEALRLADSTALAFKCWQNFIKTIYYKHYKIFGQMQRPKSVAKDPKMVAIVILLPFFLVKCRCTCKGSNSIMQRVTFLLRHTAPLLQRF